MPTSKLSEYQSKWLWSYFNNTPQTFDYISKLMYEADIALGAGGSAIWERCYLGLPSGLVTFADNQIESVKYLEKKELVKYLGHFNQLTMISLKKSIYDFISNAEYLRAFSKNGGDLIDGLGKKRIVNVILKSD